MSREEGGKGIASIEDRVDTSIRRHKKSKEKIDCNDQKKHKEAKQLYAYLKRQTSKISHEIWTELRKGNFKRETESLQLAAPQKKRHKDQLC